MGYSRLNHPGFATTAPTSDMKKATFWKTHPETLININFGKTNDCKLGERAELTRPPQSFLQAVRTATKKKQLFFKVFAMLAMSRGGMQGCRRSAWALFLKNN